MEVHSPKVLFIHAYTEKKGGQNNSPRRAVWSLVTQLSIELHFGATLSIENHSFEKKRAVSKLFRGRAFSPKHDYEEKTALLYKREQIFKITLQKSNVGPIFFSQCSLGEPIPQYCRASHCAKSAEHPSNNIITVLGGLKMSCTVISNSS